MNISGRDKSICFHERIKINLQALLVVFANIIAPKSMQFWGTLLRRSLEIKAAVVLGTLYHKFNDSESEKLLLNYDRIIFYDNCFKATKI